MLLAFQYEPIWVGRLRWKEDLVDERRRVTERSENEPVKLYQRRCSGEPMNEENRIGMVVKSLVKRNGALLLDTKQNENYAEPSQ